MSKGTLCLSVNHGVYQCDNSSRIHWTIFEEGTTCSNCEERIQTKTRKHRAPNSNKAK